MAIYQVTSVDVTEGFGRTIEIASEQYQIDTAENNALGLPMVYLFLVLVLVRVLGEKS